MHKRHDYLAKWIFGRALRTAGEAGTEVEIPPGEAQRADIVFTPDPARDAARAALGLLGRMAAAPCLIEPFHDPPDTEEVLGCVRKHLTWAHGRDRPSAGVATWLWIVSAGRPETALRDLGCRPSEGWPDGVYAAPPGLRMGIVVIPELPRVRATLLVRLLGRGATLCQAVADLTALPPEAPERAHAMDVLLQLRIADPHVRSLMTEDEQLHAQLDILLQQYTRQIMLEGEQRGRLEGEQRGEQRGRLEGEQRGRLEGEQRGHTRGRLDELRRLCERRLRRALSEDESAQLAATLGEHGPEPIEELLIDGTPEALAAWLRVRETTPSAGTRMP